MKNKSFIITLYKAPLRKHAGKTVPVKKQMKSKTFRAMSHTHLKNILKRLDLNWNHFYPVNSSKTQWEFRRLENGQWFLYFLRIEGYNRIPEDRVKYDLHKFIGRKDTVMS